jgi:hypothetical protein
LLDIDGGLDEMGAPIVDADLLIIDDADGGNKSVLASRIKTYVGAAISRSGGTSTEATTTSTSVVDLIDVGSMTIPAAAPVQLKWAMRKTTGAASAAGGGLKFNAVVVHEAAVSGNVEWLSSTANSAQDGLAWTELCGRVANYLTGADNYHTAHVTATGAQTVSNSGSPTQTAPFTAVEITNFIVRGISSSSVTLGCDEFQIYEGSVA